MSCSHTIVSELLATWKFAHDIVLNLYIPLLGIIIIDCTTSAFKLIKFAWNSIVFKFKYQFAVPATDNMPCALGFKVTQIEILFAIANVGIIWVAKQPTIPDTKVCW